VAATAENHLADEDTVAVPAPSRLARVSRRREVQLLCGYLVVSLWLWRQLIPHLATHTPGSGYGDPGMFLWWFKWTPWALTHGHDPFRTTYLNAPRGISAMWNPSVLALGVLFAPITLAFGPVVSFNIALVLGPALSAWTAALWLRRHVGTLAAGVGGLVFGFSPFVVDHSKAGHVNFTWLLLLPVMLMLLEDLLWRSQHPMWPTAPLLGLVASVQLLISSEALLIFALTCAGAIVVLACSHPDIAKQRARLVLPAACLALGVAALLSAWPLAEQFGSRYRITQPVQPVGQYGGRFTSIVTAPPMMVFHPHHAVLGHITGVEDGLYLGWPLLIALLVAAVWLIRRPGVVVAALVIVASILLQMHGTHWHAFGISVPSPLHLLQSHVPITGNIGPGRFAIVMWLAIAWIVASAIDEATTRLHLRSAIVPALVAGLVLLPLLPGPEPTTNRTLSTPSFFTSQALDMIPNGSVVMVAPMATVANNESQFWQSAADMRFRQMGGYAIHIHHEHGAPSYWPDASALVTLFGIDQRTLNAYAGPVTQDMLEDASAELRAANAKFLIVGPSKYARGEQRQRQIATELLGRSPDEVLGGVAIWNLNAGT
jgi:hypothetical protein